jgi:hypothetical protein
MPLGAEKEQSIQESSNEALHKDWLDYLLTGFNVLASMQLLS